MPPGKEHDGAENRDHGRQQPNTWFYSAAHCLRHAARNQQDEKPDRDPNDAAQGGETQRAQPLTTRILACRLIFHRGKFSAERFSHAGRVRTAFQMQMNRLGRAAVADRLLRFTAVPIFTPPQLPTTYSLVDTRKAKRPVFLFSLRSGTALSKNGERSGSSNNTPFAIGGT